VESFTIDFTDLTPATANVAMMWANTGAKFKIVADVDAKVMAQIDEKITKKRPTPRPMTWPPRPCTTPTTTRT
jgi:hypothetical protein